MNLEEDLLHFMSFRTLFFFFFFGLIDEGRESQNGNRKWILKRHHHE